MAEKLRVNPTRMELSKLRKRLNIAARGHKLLKDKRDELIKRFIDHVKKNMEIRVQVEKELTKAFNEFLMASAVMSSQVIEESVMYPTQKLNIENRTMSIMNVDVPMIKNLIDDTDDSNISDEGSIYPYGFVNTSAELDGSIETLNSILPHMLELAQIEKTCQLLADEIEKTRRRVNALEYVVVPQLKETIRFIVMKLDENERGNLTRLMKVKEMIKQRSV